MRYPWKIYKCYFLTVPKRNEPLPSPPPRSISATSGPTFQLGRVLLPPVKLPLPAFPLLNRVTSAAQSTRGYGRLLRAGYSRRSRSAISPRTASRNSASVSRIMPRFAFVSHSTINSASLSELFHLRRCLTPGP